MTSPCFEFHSIHLFRSTIMWINVCLVVVMLLQNFNELNNTSDKLSIFLTSSSTIKKWAKHIKIQVRQGLKCHWIRNLYFLFMYKLSHVYWKFINIWSCQMICKSTFIRDFLFSYNWSINFDRLNKGHLLSLEFLWIWIRWIKFHLFRIPFI